MSDVFVSYKAEDRGRIAPLVAALEKQGLTIWWDARIGVGERWRETISEQLEAASTVVVIWSHGSVGPKGQFVRDEATRALRQGTYIPVRIDPVEPPLGFGETQAIDLQNWKGKQSDFRYQMLLSAIQTRLGVESVNVPVAAGPRVTRRTAITAGGAAIVASTGVGAWFTFGRSRASNRTIAVLPFANLSGDPAQAYFSDGIAEELRSSLARIPGLKVIGRTSSEAVRNDDAKTAAGKLGVATLLTGSVRRSPSMIRVNAELINGSDGVERWSQNYDRSPGDAIHIQTDIAHHVVEALSVTLADTEQAALSLGSTSSAAAQDLFLKAREEASSGTEESYHRKIALLDQAIALDPKFAAAYALKSVAVNGLAVDFGRSSDWAAAYAQSAALARNAISLAPRLAAGYMALANNYDTQLQFSKALATYNQAAPLIGSNPSDLIGYGLFLGLMGRNAEARREISAALAIDPLNPATYASLGTVYYLAKQFPKAIELYRKTLEQKPDRRFPRAALAWSLILSGRLEEARSESAQLPEQDALRFVTDAILAAKTGDLETSDGLVAKMDSVTNGAAAWQDALIYAQRHDIRKTLEALEHALRIRDPGLSWLAVEPLMDPVRSNAAFQAFYAKLNFPRSVD